MASLPDKPSELLMASVLDAIKLQDTPGYKLNMGIWHQQYEGACNVCMAGSLMACRLGAKVKENKYFGSYKDPIRRKLLAVNQMRVGHFASGIEGDMGITLTPEQRVAVRKAGALVHAEASSNEGWLLGRACWGTYREAARILAEAGL